MRQPENYEEFIQRSAKREPKPNPNDQPMIADIVAAEVISIPDVGQGLAKAVMDRKAMGMQKYGTALQPFNGRDSLMDLFQELIDAMKYARLLMYECDAGANSYSRTELYNTYKTLTDLAVGVLKTIKGIHG